jgi:hypothetical protein
LRRIEVFFPLLPKRSLSPNSRVKHQHNSDARHEMRAGAETYLLEFKSILDMQPFQHARVSVTWHLTNRKPKIEQCPRCIHWALEHPRSEETQCMCYRPADPFNAIGALKPFFDGITEAGVWPDDTWKHVEVGRFARQSVGALADEGLYVEIEEVEE